MRRVHDMHGKGLAWRLPSLFLALAAAGAAMADQEQAPGTQDGKHGFAHPTYRVINLGAGDLSALPKINARGQVGFSAGLRGYFYDGKTTRDIGTLGSSQTYVNDLNDAGQVVGLSYIPNGRFHAYIWSAAGGMLDIGAVPGGLDSGARAINNRGVVTGSIDYVPATSQRAFRWSPQDGLEILGALNTGQLSFSSGEELNDAGLITGLSTTLSNDIHAFAWTRGGGLVDIDTLNSIYSSGAFVSPRGEVVGNRVDRDFRGQVYLWTPKTGMRDLGNGGGVSAGAQAMNRHTHIAGIIVRPDDTQRAMWWTRQGGMRNLGTLGGSNSAALAINAKDQVVGSSLDRNQSNRAFLWAPRQGMIDLNTRLRRPPPGLVVDNAVAINDSGAIVATSNAGLVLLSPVHGHKGGHAAGPIAMPALATAGVPVQATVAWIDEDRAGTRSVSWSWGDGSGEQSGRVSEANGAGSASASHGFAAPGIYPVRVTITALDGSSTVVQRHVVVAPVAGGTVVGNGAVHSPQGAFRQAPFQAGKASFSLVAPVTEAARLAGVPAQLRFDFPGLNLRSNSLRFLGQQGGQRLQRVFEGRASVQGRSGYRFRLGIIAGAAGAEPGRLALRVWHTDAASGKEVVDYDTFATPMAQLGDQLVEGRIDQD